MEEDHTFEEALGAVNATGNVVEVQPAINFNYFLPVNIAFGSGKVLETGELTNHMVRSTDRNWKKQCKEIWFI